MGLDAPLVELADYSFRIGEKAILRDVSLEVREGEFLTVIGPNGAGKSTLLKCLVRILAGGEGRIALAGRPLAEWSQRELARLLSYVPQSDGRVLPYTARAFVEMGRYPYLSPFSGLGPGDEAAVDEALERTGTAAFAERRIETLSGGERQKVLIAAALAQGARVLLLDEPTTFLDYRHQVEIEGLLRRLNREAASTILAVTHDINSALAWSERLLALKDGRVAWCGPADELVRGRTLEEIYGTRFLMAEHTSRGHPILIPEADE